MGEEHRSRGGNEMEVLPEQECGDYPDSLNGGADVVACLEPGLHFLFVFDLQGTLDGQTENDEIGHGDHGACQRTQNDLHRLEGSNAYQTQQKQGGDHQHVTDENADGDTDNFPAGSGL